MNPDLILRDRLAQERTMLANERTLLAYMRTGLALVVTGVSSYHFLHGLAAHLLGAAAAIGGIALVAFGALRFAGMRRRILALGEEKFPDGA